MDCPGVLTGTAHRMPLGSALIFPAAFSGTGSWDAMLVRAQLCHGRSRTAQLPDVCIPPLPSDVHCRDIPRPRSRVLPPDLHGFDRHREGIGCER